MYRFIVILYFLIYPFILEAKDITLGVSSISTGVNTVIAVTDNELLANEKIYVNNDFPACDVNLRFVDSPTSTSININVTSVSANADINVCFTDITVGADKVVCFTSSPILADIKVHVWDYSIPSVVDVCIKGVNINRLSLYNKILIAYAAGVIKKE